MGGRAEPYHEFAGTFLKSAAEPLSPLSADSTEAREAIIAIFAALKPRLPELLCLLHIGVVRFWVHDRSPGQQRTLTLIAGVVPLVDRLARLSRLPVVRGVINDLVDLLDTMRS